MPENSNGPVQGRQYENNDLPDSPNTLADYDNDDLVPSSPSLVNSRPMSPTSFHSSLSGHSSFLDEIKHEVMVNHLFQQQCGRLWVGDRSGELEGVLLRKRRNVYMACPPQLANSAFAQYCSQLNVQVGESPLHFLFFFGRLLSFTGRDDD